jgi:hypothetical protein
VEPFFWERSQNRWEGRRVTPSEGLHELADPRPAGEPVKTAIQRASRLCRLPYWRCFDIWYLKARRVEPEETTAIADALERKRELEAKNELAELRRRLSRLEARLLSTDEDFYRPQIDFFGRSACRIG